ncbi:hypothetical protein NDU88_008528 [Pleurodeles waltl]|uniref:Uncharacterized protein n=1 Tax=Pleurodeles waltl TaxID=8319 RepID=A0AAV7QNW4_PLEWA|nr:hypothetical protein NDU88_008528 [Pleurodeles waltl]
MRPSLPASARLEEPLGHQLVVTELGNGSSAELRPAEFMKQMTQDTSGKARTMGKYVKGPKTKTLTPATGRQRCSSEHVP